MSEKENTMSNVVGMAVEDINTVIPVGVTVDWRRYQRARKAYMDTRPADVSAEEFERLKREYELEAINMATWMDVIMQGADS